MTRAAEAPPASGPDRGQRLHAFDALRAASILGIFLWHAGLAYSDPPLRFWPVEDPARSWTFAFGLWFTRGFRLATFFVMSGFFGRLALTRTTPVGFLGQRLLRIGVPFVVTLVAYSVWLPHAPGGIVRLSPASGLWPPQDLRPLHLWFLESLLIISAVVLLLALLLPRVLPAGLLAAGRAWFGARFDRGWAPLLLVPVTVAILRSQGGQFPRTSPSSLVPDPDALLYFGVFFTFGWLLHMQSGALQRLCRHAWSWIGAGLLVRALTLIPLLPDGRPAWAPSPHYLERSIAVSDGDELLVQIGTELYAWLMVFGLMGLFLRLFRREIPVLRWIADGAYWLYLVHLAPVLLLQWALAQVAPEAVSPGAAWLRFGGVVVGSLAVILVSYELLVRYTPVGRLLHGPRRRPAAGRSAAWRWRPPDADPSA